MAQYIKYPRRTVGDVCAAVKVAAGFLVSFLLLMAGMLPFIFN